MILLLACRFPVPDGGGDDTAPPVVDEARPGILRLGPPTPSVGAYGVAADATRVFVSNLHVPFVTIVDPTTGGWAGSLDLRSCTPAAFFPRLFTYGGALWVTALDQERVCRFDLATLDPLDPVEVPRPGEAVVATDEGVWLSQPDVLRRHDGTDFVEDVTVGLWATAADVDGDDIAVLVSGTGTVRLLDRDGTVRWTVTRPETTLNSVLVRDGRVLVTDRLSGDVIALEDGAEVGRVHTGSDTFALFHHEDLALVTNRQGAALPESGAYEGDPGRVTALTWDLDVAWTVDLSKTVHWLAWDGKWWWTANEDALRMSAIDPTTGTEALRGPPIGLTLDHVAEIDGRYFMGSHLTDEVWRADFDAEDAVAVDTCGWPFVTVSAGGDAWAPCQESGDLLRFDPDTMAPLETTDVADTFMPACTDGLCTAHDALVGAAADGDGVVYTDAHLGAVRGSDGRLVDLGDFPDLADHVQHFAVEPLGDGLVAFEPRSATLYLLEDDVVTATADAADVTAPMPLVRDGDRVWAGGRAWEAGLVQGATLPEGLQAAAAGSGWVVATDEDEVVVLDGADLSEQARLPFSDLRVPPFVEIDAGEGPLRFFVDDAGELVVANVMRGTLERRALPSLAAAGGDAVVPVGRWADLEGL